MCRSEHSVRSPVTTEALTMAKSTSFDGLQEMLIILEQHGTEATLFGFPSE